jgi:hypothetical protein
MTDGVLVVRHGVPVWESSSGGPHLRSAQDALDLIGDAFGCHAEWVTVPAAGVGDEFFNLRSGLLGEIAQKFANYQTGLAIIGDITDHVAASKPLGEFVYETNRGRQLWFVATEDEFDGRLAQS